MAEQEQKELVKISGEVQNVTFHNPENGFTVLLLSQEDGEIITVVGAMAAVSPGESLALAGNYIEHPRHGIQFEAMYCEYEMPEGSERILRYLSGGALPGIGAATAKKIVRQFGDEALEILAREPEKLTQIKGFTLEKAKKASVHFLQTFSIREAVAALSRMGLSVVEAVRLYKECGKDVLNAVAQNPYMLCAQPLQLNFARVDAIAVRLNIDRDSGMRVAAAILYTLRHNMGNGHTCLPKEKLLKTVCEYFAIEPQIVCSELNRLCEQGQLQQAEYGQRCFVYPAESYRAEMSVALRMRDLLKMPTSAMKNIAQSIERRQAQCGIQYAPLQKMAIEGAMSNSVMVITGGPGTGKTTTVNAIIALYEQQAERVLLAAPTGRAAKRMAELTGRKASTIHRLLEVDFSAGMQTPRFKHNTKNPLRCDVLIVDEMSMVDIFLFESLLEALRSGCRLVLVGDANQLPSVGPGDVLRSIIRSGIVPTVELNEIFRQAAKSLIVSNAHRIVHGEMPQKGGREDDWFFISSAGEECRRQVCEIVSERLPAKYAFSPKSDIQVLCPGRKGALGTWEMNIHLQQVLNPPSPEKGEIKLGQTAFRLGDKVMQTRNNYDIPFTKTDGEVGAGAFNGDIGIIERINPAAGTLTVLCDERYVEYTAEEMQDLELAYAVTVHKSQGSEFEAVVMVLCDVPVQLQYRNLFYTAVTRAKQLCVLVGRRQVMERMVQGGQKKGRFTCLEHILTDEDIV